MADSTADREIVTTRVFDAPPELVFAAWIEPERFSQWMGPRGFTTKVHSMDVRTGGQSLYTMTGPDGTAWMNRARFRTVVPRERLEYVLDDGVDGGAAGIEVTVSFVALAGGKQTQLTMRSVFATVAEFERVKGFGAVELGVQTMDKLAEHLAAR